MPKYLVAKKILEITKELSRTWNLESAGFDRFKFSDPDSYKYIIIDIWFGHTHVELYDNSGYMVERVTFYGLLDRIKLKLIVGHGLKLAKRKNKLSEKTKRSDRSMSGVDKFLESS